MSGDTAVADACLAYEAETGLSLLPADEMHGAAFRALKESWNYALLGECSVDKANAWQEIQLQVLDFSKMEKELQTETRIQLLELARGMNREDVYDEGGNYRPAVAERAYDQAMINLLQNAQNFYSTIGCRVELILTGDGWKIIPTKSLISALSGNLG